MTIRNNTRPTQRINYSTVAAIVFFVLYLNQIRVNTSSNLSQIETFQQVNKKEQDTAAVTTESTITTISSPEKNDENFEFNPKLPICPQLKGRSAAQLWNQQQQQHTHHDNNDIINNPPWWLIEASMHPKDPNQIHRGWITKLAEWIGSQPQLLIKGKLKAPNEHQIRHVLQIVEKKLQDPVNAPPLRVVVFGGSVTWGAICEKLPKAIQDFIITEHGDRSKETVKGKACAWPQRLQNLINYVLSNNINFGQNNNNDIFDPKYPIIRIYALTLPGTGSASVTPIMKYRFYADKELREHGPDIIINGYCANDSRPVDRFNLQFNYESNFKTTQTFIRVANKYNIEQQLQQQFKNNISNCDIDNNDDDDYYNHPKIDPLMILYVNEYMGNANDYMIPDRIRDATVRYLSAYYDIGYISYADVAQLFVYSSTSEALFNPDWSERDVHLLMPGHVMMTWVIAFNVLSMLIDYCDSTTFAKKHKQQHEEQQVEQDNKLTTYIKERQEQFHRLSQVLPPQLTINSTLSEISQEWEHDFNEQNQIIKQIKRTYCNKKDDATTAAVLDPKGYQLCPFAFLASQIGTAPNARALNAYLNRYKIFSNGWNGEDYITGSWANKLGLISHGSTTTTTIDNNNNGSNLATILFKIQNIHIPIQEITIQHLKSYGEKWDGSVAQFELFYNDNKNNNDDDEEMILTTSTIIDSSSSTNNNYNNELVWSANITGYHDTQTSVSYSYEATLEPPIPIGSTVYLRITHLSGREFKIMAILLCSL